MREVAFIKQNKEKWKEIEGLLTMNNPAPERLNKAFDSLANDLAYSQTYYPKSKLVTYLNALTQNIYQKIYKPSIDIFGFVYFFTKEVPLILYRYRKIQYFSMAFFIASALLGVLGMYFDEDFVRAILGNSYVDMTLENIANANPTAVYENNNLIGSYDSFIQIMLNNLRVSLLCFISGLLMGIGSLYLMFENGMMVGVFLKNFENEGVFWEAMKVVFIHGSFELFAITVVGTAGILLGFSYLFPGSLSRKQSFKIKGKHAVKIFISTIPFIVVAAFLEGFVTQEGNDMKPFFAFLICISTFFIIGYYYLIYPIFVSRKYDWQKYQFSDWIDEF